MFRAIKSLIAAAASLAVVSMASADDVYGLTATAQLVRFNSATPNLIQFTSPAITGLVGGDSIVDIDYYPVNGQLYGIGNTTGTLYNINPLTGFATIDVVPQSSLGSPTDMDFNPAADRLRVFSTGDQNFRMTPSVNTAGPTGANAGLVTADGMLMYAPMTPNPDLVANAYTNNFDGTPTTALYSIDTDSDTLVLHSGAPQFSILNTVGPLGFGVGSLVGFDISAANFALVSDRNTLYTVNLATGQLTLAGIIGTPGGALDVTTIAIIPAPSAIALLGLGSLVIARRRR
ncbi:MAG: DUF4394 domain-containing protein [Phycisphaerales bacterium]|nr:DUF4394 domain-containing protein [Phycisphaerales bacterium]